MAQAMVRLGQLTQLFSAETTTSQPRGVYGCFQEIRQSHSQQKEKQDGKEEFGRSKAYQEGREEPVESKVERPQKESAEAAPESPRCPEASRSGGSKNLESPQGHYFRGG